MAEIHDLIERLGKEEVRHSWSSPLHVDLAAQMMACETDALAYTYSDLTLTSLPHKRLPDDRVWERRGNLVTLFIEPGILPNAQGSHDRHGVPFGAQARLILIYLQTEAIRRQSPEIELGRSMYDWLGRMGVSVGGKTYRSVREQAKRLSACRMTLSRHDGKRVVFQSDSIVKRGMFLAGEADPDQPSLWSEGVVLSDTFFKELTQHAVPFSEEAVAKLNNNSLSLDIYVWLAYRLHHLSKPIDVSWGALAAQFGADGYKRFRDFKKRFAEAFELALAVYPEAQAQIRDDDGAPREAGVRLYPSRAPLSRPLVAGGGPRR